MIFRFLEFELDAELYELRHGEERLPAEQRVIDVLLHLVRNRDRVVAREDFLAACWPDVVVRDRAVDQMIYTARKLLNDDAAAPRCIETVRGRGWRFVAEVFESALRRWPDGSLPPGEIPFIGRKEEMATLESALEAAKEGRGSLVVVHGEPGIGKSRLIEEFGHRAARQGARVYLGRCPEVDGAPPFWPWTQLLRAHRLSVGEAAWEALLEARPQLGQISPELDQRERWRERVRPSQMGNDQFLLYDTITRFWQEVAQDSTGLVLLLDDIHRADDASYELLRYLASEVRESSLSIAASSRVHGGKRRFPLPCSQVSISSLRESEIREFTSALVESRDGSPTEQDVSHLAGNPFFLKLTFRGSAGIAPDKSAIEAHLGELPAGTRIALCAAAVCGERFSERMLTSAFGEDVVRHYLGPAIEIGVVRWEEQGELRFSHTLLRDAIHQCLPEKIRSSLHARIGTELLGQGFAGVEVAHHLAESRDRSDVQLAYFQFVAAGRNALQQYAFEDARTYLNQALAMSQRAGTSPDGLVDLEILLGEAEVRAGLREDGVRRLSSVSIRARSGSHSRHLADAALAICPGPLQLEIGVVDLMAVSLLENALSQLEDLDPVTIARLRARLAVALQAVPEEASHRAALLSDALSDDTLPIAVRAEVGLAEVVSSWSPDQTSERSTKLKLLGGLARAANELELEGIARVLEAASVQQSGAGTEFRIVTAEFRTWAKASRLTSLEWFCDLHTATQAIDSGDFASARVAVDSLKLAAGRAGGANAENAAAILQFAIAWHTGDYETAGTIALVAATRYPRLLAWSCAHGLALAKLGRKSEARSSLDQISEAVLCSANRDLMWLPAATSLGDLCAYVGTNTECSQIRSVLGEYSGTLVGIGYAALNWGAVDRVLARLLIREGDVRGAVSALETAEEVTARARAPVWSAPNLVESARALMVVGSSESISLARSVASRALAMARSSGQLGIVAEAQSIAARLGELAGN